MADAVALALLVFAFTNLIATLHIKKRIKTMDQAETQAFSDLNTKVDALIALTDSIKSQLDAALAAGDSAGIVAAAQAVSAKIDAEVAKLSPTPAPTT